MTPYRRYRYSDAKLLEMAGVIQAHFAERKALFTSFDPEVTAVWLEQKMAAAKALTLDEFERGRTARYTEELQKHLQHCHALVTRIRYYVEVVLEEQNAMRTALGLHTYSRKRRCKADHLLWLRSFAVNLEDYRGQLEEAGAPAWMLDELVSTVGSMQESNSLQENSKGLRGRHAEERIIALNELFKALKRIEKLAGVVYIEGEHELRLFHVPTMLHKRKRRVEPVAEEVDAQTVGNDSAAVDMPPVSAPSPRWLSVQEGTSQTCCKVQPAFVLWPQQRSGIPD